MTQEQQRQVEVALVLHLLRDDHDETWAVAELEQAMSHRGPLVVRQALGELAREAVVAEGGGEVRATAPVRHLDTLGMIAV
jgi:hypothetical protein